MGKVRATLVGRGSIRAKLYDLGDYPGARQNGASSARQVKGELYRLRDAQNAIRLLDEYEEFFPGEPRRSLFVRRRTQVALEDGGTRIAWVYLYNRPVDESRLIPNGDYRNPARRLR